VEGSWEGPLTLPFGKLRIRIHISKSPDGKLAGKMDSVDQSAFGIPIDTVTFAEGALKWDVKAIQGTYEGTLSAGGQEIAGTFSQAGQPLPLVFKRMDKIPDGPKRPQEPKPPFPYSASDVTFASKADGVTLAGTLTVPPGSGPFPAVALATGSGPQDRDEQLAGHKPFAVLADHLTRNGFAVLRYDDRGFGKSTGVFATATSADFANDLEGALDFLLTRAEVDRKRVGLLGHSEGGILAPMVAARRKEVACIVLLAGTGVPGTSVILEQGQRMAAASGVPEEQRLQARAKQNEFYSLMRDSKDDGELKTKLKTMFGEGPQGDSIIRQATSPWFKYFLFYDPAPAMERVKCPVLLVNGELDLQVLPDQNLPPLVAALKKGGNSDVKVVRLAGLNHLLQTAKSGLPTEYGQIEETMAPAALDSVSSWLREKAGLEKVTK
jgi:hypothetical protein